MFTQINIVCTYQNLFYKLSGPSFIIWYFSSSVQFNAGLRVWKED